MLEHHPDDLDLLRHYREHDDQHAFTELVTHHVNLVYGTAYRLLKDTQLSEDASQRVFTALARKGKCQDIRHVSSWLYAVTQREVLSMIRSESRRSRREREAFDLEMLAQRPNQDRETSIEAINSMLGDALKRLSDADQQAAIPPSL